MANITVCCRFRPLSSKEKRDNGDSVCIRSMDNTTETTFIFKDEKEEELAFSFDRVFYEESLQSDVYQFLALPILQAAAVNAINGTIITYGQTGAGKTYSMEGPSISERDELKKGLLPRVVEGLFECIKSANDESVKYSIKLSMVEIYMEKVRDLLDLSKDNILIKESKVQGILLSGVTEISISEPIEALQILSNGIVNRAVGETQMNTASSRSHCMYIFTVQQALANKRTKTGKVILVDLAGSEKVEKTGAEGKVLEEAKTINKSLSAIGNVINALTCSPSTKSAHIPYRDSKLTRILQDALGGTSRTALLCCCSPSPLNAAETLSTLRFGARAKHIKSSFVNHVEVKLNKSHRTASPTKDESCERILNRLRESLDVEDVELLEELFILEGILFDLNSVEDLESAYEDDTLRTMSSLQQAVEELVFTIEELKCENKALRARIAVAERTNAEQKETQENASVIQRISDMLSFFISWVGLCPLFKMMK